MNKLNKLDKQMQSLIKKERLNDQDVFFADYGTFEEIPLFSRWSYVDFLKEYSFDKRNEILIEQAIKLIDEALTNGKSIPNLNFNEYFICISITRWESVKERGCISPNVYISKRKSWLLSFLELAEFETPETIMIKNYLCNLNVKGKKVCVSKSYGCGNDRIYIVDEFFLN
jgi:hypothetical protein